MRSDGRAAAGAALALLAPAPALAIQYLGLEAAQLAVFPEARRFEPVALSPTPAQLASWTAAAGAQPPRGQVRAWRVQGASGPLGWLLTDEVLGREEFIDYALGVNADGTLRPPEVMAYREAHGGEIRNRAWLAQFRGRGAGRALRAGVDIQCIAGATLSCEHVTAGVRFLQAIAATLAAAAP